MNTKFVLAFLAALLFSGILVNRSAAQQKRPSGNSKKIALRQPSFIFHDVEPVIRRKSHVPPMLPAVLPYADESDSIHALLQSADDFGYDILLANELPCEGQNWCLYGSVRGNVKPFQHSFNHVSPKAEPVTLSNGVRGGFIAANCEAYCSQAYVEWHQNGYYYSIGVKAGERKQLVEMANSAIATAR